MNECSGIRTLAQCVLKSGHLWWSVSSKVDTLCGCVLKSGHSYNGLGAGVSSKEDTFRRRECAIPAPASTAPVVPESQSPKPHHRATSGPAGGTPPPCHHHHPAHHPGAERFVSCVSDSVSWGLARRGFERWPVGHRAWDRGTTPRVPYPPPSAAPGRGLYLSMYSCSVQKSPQQNESPIYTVV